jgi:hypothetical protein
MVLNRRYGDPAIWESETLFDLIFFDGFLKIFRKYETWKILYKFT